MLVNELEKYTNAIFIGEPTGGKVNCYGDSSRIILPNSGITARVSTLWWQEDERDERPLKAPDIAADLTIADYRANGDPALQAALDYVPKKSLGELMTVALAADNPDAIGKRFVEWRSDPANAYVDAEPLLNSLGYELLAQKRVEQSIRVFQLNVAVHPQSPNVYDSLGEACVAIGDTESAIKNYEKALALNPKMISARDALKKLCGK
jgi:tetratricopeptide (TPR) repeat protein